MNDEKQYFRMRKCGRGRRATAKQTIPAKLCTAISLNCPYSMIKICSFCKYALKQYSDTLHQFPYKIKQMESLKQRTVLSFSGFAFAMKNCFQYKTRGIVFLNGRRKREAVGGIERMLCSDFILHMANGSYHQRTH